MKKERQSTVQPNERLKQERLLRGWTQADVAGFIGTDGYTVNRWERGRSHPGPYFRKKLCELFETTGADLGLFPFHSTPLQRDATASSCAHPLPALWSVPQLRNPYFTGREEILQTLLTRLPPVLSETHLQVSALCGLGGVGKTQIALEYAYCHIQDYRAVFWIEAETLERIHSSILRIAEVLDLPERTEMKQQRIVTALQRWLATHSQWLLIWDGLENLDLLQPFLSPLQKGALLITTRCQALGSLARGLPVAPMLLEEGILFVLRRARVLEATITGEHLEAFARYMPASYAAARGLVIMMGGLPLALDQAGAYIEETGSGLAGYLRRYEQQRSQLLDRRGITVGNHPQSVTTTFLLISRQVEQKHKAAADVLRVCAFLHAEAIPEALFVTGASHLGPLLAPMAHDPIFFDQVIATLRSFSLVQRFPETQTLSLHRLVQVVVQEAFSEQERLLWLERTIAALTAVFPEDDGTIQKHYKHLLTVIDAWSENSAQPQLAETMQKMADDLRGRTRYDQTKTLYQQAVGMSEQLSGSNTPRATSALSGLALISYEHEHYEQARVFYQSVLHLQGHVWGAEEREVARSLKHPVILSLIEGKDKKPENTEIFSCRKRAAIASHTTVFFPR